VSVPERDMVNLEERFMIRDMYRKGQSISAIARQTGRDRKTIRKVIQAGLSGAGDKSARRRRQSGVKLAPFEGYLKQRIAEGVLNTRKLLRELKARGYAGGLTQLILYVQPYRTAREEQAVVRFETEPGQQAQVDWTSLGYITLDGRQRRVYAFVMTLCYSRMMYVEFTTSTEVSTWLRCHQHAFEYFGGVPRELLHDNLKTAVLSRGAGGKIQWNPRYLDFALYYGFSPHPCKPYRAQTKGKVERRIGYLQQSFWVGLHFVDMPDLNSQALEWVQGVANVRIHGTTGVTPLSRFGQEHLQPLPLTRFDTSPITHRQATRDCTVHYRGNVYSVPAAHARQMLLLKESEDGWLHIYTAEQQLVAEHRLVSGRYQRVIVAAHYAGLPQQTPTRKAALARQVDTPSGRVHPELAEVVEARPLSVYAQLAEVDYD
jgi:transposase